MKKTILFSMIFGVLLLAGCNSINQQSSTNNKKNNTEKLIGGACEYNSYPGKCKITNIQRADNGNIVNYTYSTNKKINQNLIRKTYRLTLLNGSNPSSNFLEKYNIYTGKVFNCTFKVIKKGTCTPTMIDLSGVNITDYQAQKPNGNYFKNKYFSVNILPGWKIKNLGDGKVEISKNNYILVINPKAVYAGGIDGGNFNVIIENLPRKKLVINFLPAVKCGTGINKQLGNGIQETDMLYSNKNYIKGACNKLNNKNTIWYLSYFSKDNGYFFKNNQDNTHYVVLATYSTDNINNLPSSSEYKQYLGQIATMVKSIK